jgi:ABC-type uncharacterized transport system auxiliary subunit
MKIVSAALLIAFAACLAGCPAEEKKEATKTAASAAAPAPSASAGDKKGGW